MKEISVFTLTTLKFTYAEIIQCFSYFNMATLLPIYIMLELYGKFKLHIDHDSRLSRSLIRRRPAMLLPLRLHYAQS